jgi:deazaflavin-dependent oxidoreductase (nitroreductase family)
MRNWAKTFTAINVFVFRISHGHMGNRLGKQSVLLLHTVGRNSGKSFLTSLTFFRDGATYLLVASNWGKEYHPDWFHNLMQHPYTTIQVGPTTIQVKAHEAEGDDYTRLWQLVAQQNEQYLHYQKDLKRRIPIVILTPTEPA